MTLQDAVLRKVRESSETKQQFFENQSVQIAELGCKMADRFQKGSRLYVMGNGGSACDAMHVAVEFTHPIMEKRRPLPAHALMADMATVTAIGNDIDFSRVFVNQLRVVGRSDDMALAISSSGKSPNLIYALEAAKELGMLTIALSGKDGGRLATIADHSFVVRSFSIHRIQEVHAIFIHVLWDLVHMALGEEDVI